MMDEHTPIGGTHFWTGMTHARPLCREGNHCKRLPHLVDAQQEFEVVEGLGVEMDMSIMQVA